MDISDITFLIMWYHFSSTGTVTLVSKVGGVRGSFL